MGGQKTAFQKQLLDERTNNRPQYQKLPAIRFGMHKGTPINEIPTGYLHWMTRGDFAEDHPDLAAMAKIALAMPKAPLKHKKKQQPKPKVKKAKSKPRKKESLVMFRGPFPATHPVPADVILDPMEECPFEVDEPMDELDREFRAIVG